jgi:hypothetical protein
LGFFSLDKESEKDLKEKKKNSDEIKFS